MGLRILSKEFDEGRVAGGAGETAITSDERRVEQFRECDIHSVIRRNVLSKRPYTSQKRSVRMPRYGKSPKERNGHLTRLIADVVTKPRASYDVSDFSVEELRCMEILGPAKESLQGSGCSAPAEENLRRDRGIDNDHAELRRPPSRTSRITSTGSRVVFTGGRLRRRSIISSSVGTAAICSRYRTKY
jgi:hypothetical protein